MAPAATEFASSRRDILRAGGARCFSPLRREAARRRFRRPPLPEGDAYAPWRLWNDPALRNTPLALVAAAVLAANPHDTQPWLFHVRHDAIEIYADLSRNLGAMDAFLREMHLGLGCAIENMMTAAGANGFEVELQVGPGSLLDLTERAGRSLRRACICSGSRGRRPTALRRDRNTPHQSLRLRPARIRRPPNGAIRAHAGADDEVKVLLFDDGSPQRPAFDAAVVEATEAIIADKTMIADSDRWFRASTREIDAHRDGPTLDAAGLSTADPDVRQDFSGFAGDQPAGLALPDARRPARERADGGTDRLARPL